MTIAATRAKREAQLCPSITQLLQADGSHVWEEATIRAGDEGTRTADHVAWRWDGGDIVACAVEVKAGRADVGFAQAVAYEVGFERVYVAAEEWQICGQVVENSACTWLSLLAEGKGIGVRAAALKPERFGKAIEALPGCRLVLRRREHKGYRPVHNELLTWRPSDGAKALNRLLRNARALGVERNVGPQFQILMDFWPHGLRIGEEDARAELVESVTRLRTIRDELNA